MSKKLKIGLIAGASALVLLIIFVPVAFMMLNKIGSSIAEKNETKREIAEDRAFVEPILEEIAARHGLDDLVFEKSYDYSSDIYYESEKFTSLSDEQKLYFLEEIEKNESLSNYQKKHYDHRSKGISIVVNDYYYSCYKGKGELLINRRVVFEMETTYALEKYEEEKNKPEFIIEKCEWCNGTGKIKYYYGGSELEAILDGHEDSWYGQCGACGGTGLAD